MDISIVLAGMSGVEVHKCCSMPLKYKVDRSPPLREKMEPNNSNNIQYDILALFAILPAGE